jgi:hypothetical protein
MLKQGVFMQFQGGLEAYIIEQNNAAVITVNCPEDGKFKIIGFETHEQAKDFLTMGDFNKQDNDYLRFVNPKLKLIWAHEI